MTYELKLTYRLLKSSPISNKFTVQLSQFKKKIVKKEEGLCGKKKKKTPYTYIKAPVLISVYNYCFVI